MAADRSFELFERHYGRTVQYLIAQFGLSRDDALDLAQDAFLRVLKSGASYREDAQWPFIKTTAHNVAVNWIRDRKAAKRSGVNVSVDDAGQLRDARQRADDTLARREQAVALRKLIAKAVTELPEGVRLCYLLRRRGYSYDEIRRMLDITMDAVKSRLHEAKRRIRDSVGGLPPGLDWSDLAGETNHDDE